MSDNSAVIKIIAKHTKEYNALLSEHNTLLEVHTKTVNELFILKDNMMEYLDENADIEAERYKVNKENKDLRKLLKEAQKECRMVQQSLDDAQTEIERLNEEWELVVKRDLG